MARLMDAWRCSHGSRVVFQVVFLLLAFMAQPGHGFFSVTGLEFDLVFQTKCVFEDVIFESNVLLKYDAYQQSAPDVGVPLSVRVHDGTGKEVFNKVDTEKLETTLSGLEEGRYKICFTAKNYHTAQNTRIKFVWEEGVESKDWGNIAKRDKTDAVHTELLRLEEAAHVMHYELQHIRRKEEKMRDVSGTW